VITERFSARGEFQKRAETAEEGKCLRHEARVLEMARHPGVVEMLGLEGDTLRLRVVDGCPFSELVGPSDGDLTRIALAAATTLADLHDIGVAHRGVTAEHLLISQAGRPVLCSFGRARVGPVDRPVAMADVQALVAAVAGDHRPPILVAAAQGAHGPFPARRFAHCLATSMGEPPPRQRLRPAARSAALASATIAVVAGTFVLGGVGPNPAPPPAAARGIVAGPSGRYRIGRPGDVVVLGRWGCGAALPALLRPATGELWVWDRWATAEDPQPARLVRRIPGARSVSVEPGPSCDRLRVTGRDGTVVVIRPDQPT
jgi:hypothetical protein